MLNNNQIDVNKSRIDGATPFWISCSKGHLEIVKLLLNDERVEIHKVENVDYWTPFYVACYWGRIEIVEYILASEREINLTTQNENGKTALDIARAGEKIERNEDQESIEDFRRRKRTCPKIAQLLELIEINANERIKLRVQLGLASKIFDYFLFSIANVTTSF